MAICANKLNEQPRSRQSRLEVAPGVRYCACLGSHPLGQGGKVPDSKILTQSIQTVAPTASRGLNRDPGHLGFIERRQQQPDG